VKLGRFRPKKTPKIPKLAISLDRFRLTLRRLCALSFCISVSDLVRFGIKSGIYRQKSAIVQIPLNLRSSLSLKLLVGSEKSLRDAKMVRHTVSARKVCWPSGLPGPFLQTKL